MTFAFLRVLKTVWSLGPEPGYMCLMAEPAPLSVSEALSLFWSLLYPKVTAHVLPTSQL